MIHTLHFSINIKAKKSEIWKALWDDQSYRNWVGIFSEGSYAVTNQWKEHSKVLFLGPALNGIYSVIERHIPNEIMQFKHIGLVKNGEQQPADEGAKAWSGSTESYRLKADMDSVLLEVEIDVLDEHLDFMKNTFPKALEIVKHNCK